ADPRRLPRTPSAGRGVRRPHRARAAADAWQDQPDPAPRARPVRRARQSVRGDALSLADRRAGLDSRGAGTDRLDPGGRGDGTQAPRARDLGRSVPPGIGAHPPRPQADRELPHPVPPAAERAAMIQTAIARAVAREDLPRELARATMEQMLAGEATPAQIGALVVGLRMKGETPLEIAGMAEALRQ